ncbi:MAG: heparan-alpha-glucosaminide N-acetyltransferase domain-containing protein [Leptospiraceae bacterium]|nr:heparan-alpha-glucosaminide N-acetyltransferase domain-containing protein [Leptospiraceae bacterium]
MTNTIKQRDRGIDVLKGIAVFTMIFSNVAGEVLVHPHPLFLRLIGSLAAPIFVGISGYLFFLSVSRERVWKKIGERLLVLLFVSSSIDVFLWRIYPFFTVDVIYIIAISTLVISLMHNAQAPTRLIIAFVIIGLTPFVQDYFVYNQSLAPNQFYKDGAFDFSEPIIFSSVIKRYFIDGWFPFFPWVGIGILGTLIKEWRLPERNYRNNLLLIYLGIILITIGIVLWKHEFKMEKRENYTELFYPPTISYVLVYSGIVLLIERIFSKERNIGKLFLPIEILGKRTLLFYILHFILISVLNIISTNMNRKFNIDEYFLATSVVIFICFVVGFILERFNEKLQDLPSFVKTILGG